VGGEHELLALQHPLDHQWIILFRNTRRSVCAEIVLRSLAGYRLMGPRNFLPEDIQQLQNVLAAYSLASKQEEADVPLPCGAWVDAP
jgi:hypothetical protein